MLERKDVDSKYKWDLSKIYGSEEEFLADYKKCERLFSDFKKYKGGFKSAEGLCEALDRAFEIQLIIERLWQYAYLGFAVDTSDNRHQALTAKVRDLSERADSATWFVDPEILKLPRETVEGWLREYEPLSEYSRYIEKLLRTKEHTLSDECEKLITDLGGAFGSHDEIRTLFAGAEMKFPKIKDESGKSVELTDTNYGLFIRSTDRQTRRRAFRALYETIGGYKNTIAALYAARVKEDCVFAKVRGYKSSLHASTFRDETDPEIYNNLIKTVEGSLEPLYEYYELKRRVLGVDVFHLYDVYAPLVGKLSVSYEYERAVEEVLKTVKLLGAEYHDNLKAGLCERGWVDVYPTRAKRGGAFSSNSVTSEPYILLNYNGKYDDMSTLAHEAGHSMHTWFSLKYNSPKNARYRIFVAEVASTVNELLLSHRMLKEAESDEEKLYILNQIMESYKATLYRQTMFASFEKKVHAMAERGEPLTAESLCAVYRRLNCKYFGKGVAVDRQIDLEWARIPHFFSPFYVYKYATCISAASAIVKRIETEGDAYISKYIDFLKCGDSRSPIDSLLVAGIDMRDPAVVRAAIEDFGASVRQFKEIYDKKEQEK
jgi:oligoendopeptidase F